MFLLQWEVLDEIWPPNASTQEAAKTSTSKLHLDGLEKFQQLVQLIHTLGFVPVPQEMIQVGKLDVVRREVTMNPALWS